MKYFSLVPALVAAVSLAACAGGGHGSPPDSTSVAASGRDRVTESDEAPGTRRARVRLELASAYFSRGQLTTALDEVKLAIAADPQLVGAFNLRGLIYASLGDENLAEESFRKALQLNGKDADTLQNYGWFLCQRLRFENADALFDRALAVPLYQNTPRTLATKGSCYARNGRLEQAEAALTRAYEVDTGNPFVLFSLAEVLYRRGQHERARFLIRRVNGKPELSNPQTLWLGIKIENRLGNTVDMQVLGRQLQERFPQSNEAAAFESGKFNE